MPIGAAAQPPELATTEMGDVATAEDDATGDDPARLVEQPHDRKSGDALAGSGFADDAYRLSRRDLEAHPVDGAHHPASAKK